MLRSKNCAYSFRNFRNCTSVFAVTAKYLCFRLQAGLPQEMSVQNRHRLSDLLLKKGMTDIVATVSLVVQVCLRNICF